ncbi:MAG: MBL fold metallo-hydrolase [bacterium]
MAKEKYKITFCSGAETVTGADFLLEGPLDSTGQPLLRILVDCGLVQGEKLAQEENWEPFSYDPKTIDYLFVTHSHIDHIGRIPKLVHDGFKGKIIATPPTCALVKPMLEDTSAILSHDTEHHLDEIYNADVLKQALTGWIDLPYEKEYQLIPEISVSLHDAGHVLGSAYVTFKLGKTKLTFTGDLGNSPSPILKDTTPMTDSDYLLIESVYGDRLHEARDKRRDMLKDVLLENYKKEGTLIIPAFSLERSQEVIFEIDKLIETKQIPKMPVYLDSPLAITVTDIYREYKDCFNDDIRTHIEKGNDPFAFPGLVETVDAEESKAILHKPDPKVIIAGSGMSSGGRVLHHEQNYLSNKNNTLLLIGYQAVGTLGRKLEEGTPYVTINKQSIPVHASIKNISGYSGHKDSDALVEFVSHSASTLKKVWTVMGEPKSTSFLAQKIKNELGLDAESPEGGKSVIIECE